MSGLASGAEAGEGVTAAADAVQRRDGYDCAECAAG